MEVCHGAWGVKFSGHRFWWNRVWMECRPNHDRTKCTFLDQIIIHGATNLPRRHSFAATLRQVRLGSVLHAFESGGVADASRRHSRLSLVSSWQSNQIFSAENAARQSSQGLHRGFGSKWRISRLGSWVRKLFKCVLNFQDATLFFSFSHEILLCEKFSFCWSRLLYQLCKSFQIGKLDFDHLLHIIPLIFGM